MLTCLRSWTRPARCCIAEQTKSGERLRRFTSVFSLFRVVLSEVQIPGPEQFWTPLFLRAVYPFRWRTTEQVLYFVVLQGVPRLVSQVIPPFSQHTLTQQADLLRAERAM